MIKIDNKYQPILLEALEELMYKLSLQLDDFKGEPLGDERKRLTKKQAELEKLQHLISSQKS
ncbi:hypothetical protein [Ekhidna sp.]|uniref:hypothetical protein n=1 Tax=Ekhidna sp. TaxID=2608089 RepID=UPI003C7BCF95